MNKKGEFNMMNVLIITAVALIVGVVLLAATANSIYPVTNTATVINQTFTFPQSGAYYNFTGYQAVSSVIVYNTTNGKTIGSTNYSTSNYVPLNGVATSYLQGNSTVYNGSSENISFVGEPIGYATDSGSRAVISLIVIMGALAILSVALYPTIKESGFLNSLSIG